MAIHLPSPLFRFTPSPISVFGAASWLFVLKKPASALLPSPLPFPSAAALSNICWTVTESDPVIYTVFFRQAKKNTADQLVWCLFLKFLLWNPEEGTVLCGFVYCLIKNGKLWESSYIFLLTVVVVLLLNKKNKTRVACCHTFLVVKETVAVLIEQLNLANIFSFVQKLPFKALSEGVLLETEIYSACLPLNCCRKTWVMFETIVLTVVMCIPCAVSKAPKPNLCPLFDSSLHGSCSKTLPSICNIGKCGKGLGRAQLHSAVVIKRVSTDWFTYFCCCQSAESQSARPVI